MLELQHVSKEYNSKSGKVIALSDISLKINESEIFGVIGHSGAGKSTLIRLLNLLESPTTGKVIVDGKNLLALSPKELRAQRHNIGMIFQHFNLISTKTVFENIALPLKLLKTPKAEIKKRVDELLQFVNLSDKTHAYPGQLSGGQKQRVAVARALATNPKILLCDEATSALDPEATHSILELLKTINAELGITIVLITHQMNTIKHICHRVAVLDTGKIVETESVIDFFTKPKTSIGKRLIDNSMKLSLPEVLQENISDSRTDKHRLPILEIIFQGNDTKQPIISTVSKEFNVDFNIIQANIETVQGSLIGIMHVEACGEEDNINKACQKLTALNIDARSLGYASVE